jgi:hypothetical protein
MGKERTSEWHHDRSIAFLRSYAVEAYRKLEEGKRAKDKFISRNKKALRGPDTGWKLSYGKRARRLIKLFEEDNRRNQTPKIEENIEDLARAHPFLIGPATADSLMNRSPDRLDYIENGQFPFDNTFFEMMDPIGGTKLGERLGGTLCGVQVRKTNGERAVLPSGANLTPYRLSVIYELKNGGYAYADMGVTIEGQRIRAGNITIPEKGERISFINDMLEENGELKDDRIVFSRETEPIPYQGHVITAEDVKDVFRSGPSRFELENRASEVDDGSLLDGFRELNNFAVNLRKN